MLTKKEKIQKGKAFQNIIIPKTKLVQKEAQSMDHLSTCSSENG
jgi:hypothetical protein